MVTILSIFKHSYYEVIIDDNLDSGDGRLVRMFQGFVEKCWCYPVVVLSKLCLLAHVRTLAQDSHTSLCIFFPFFNPTFTILEPSFLCNCLLPDKHPTAKTFSSYVLVLLHLSPILVFLVHLENISLIFYYWQGCQELLALHGSAP